MINYNGKTGFDKLKSGWGSIDNALLEMKKQWKAVFEENIDDAFDAIWDTQSLKGSLFDSGKTKAEAKIDFTEMVNTKDDALFKFIKVE